MGRLLSQIALHFENTSFHSFILRRINAKFQTWNGLLVALSAIEFKGRIAELRSSRSVARMSGVVCYPL
jgi:hypothetical protein